MIPAPDRPDPDVETARFLSRVPDLFEAVQEREEWDYNRIIHGLEDRHARPRDLEAIAAFAPDGGAAKGLREDPHLSALNDVLEAVRFPDVTLLLDLADAPGVTLPYLTTVLHFFHPAFPLLEEDACRALRRMGHRVRYPTEVSEAGLSAYRGYIAAVEGLRPRLRPRQVPASNCWMARILQASLGEWGRRTADE